MIGLVFIALLASPTVGEKLPWFAGWSATDQVINRDVILASPARGRVIVLFATWCKPCEGGLEALKQAAADGTLPGVELTLVACGEAPTVVEPWLAARGLADQRVIYDRFGAIAGDLGVARSSAGARTLALPRVVVAEPGGIVRAILDGPEAHEIDRITGALGLAPVKSPAAR